MRGRLGIGDSHGGNSYIFVRATALPSPAPPIALFVFRDP